MSDLIDRQALKKAIGKIYACDWDDIEKYFNFAEVVNSLPSAEPERKTGEWVDGKPYVNSHWRVCSVCHETSPDSAGGYNYCPNCGADMRGER